MASAERIEKDGASFVLMIAQVELHAVKALGWGERRGSAYMSGKEVVH